MIALRSFSSHDVKVEAMTKVLTLPQPLASAPGGNELQRTVGEKALPEGNEVRAADSRLHTAGEPEVGESPAGTDLGARAL
jgi:hypothetical protein